MQTGEFWNRCGVLSLQMSWLGHFEEWILFQVILCLSRSIYWISQVDFCDIKLMKHLLFNYVKKSQTGKNFQKSQVFARLWTDFREKILSCTC